MSFDGELGAEQTKQINRAYKGELISLWSFKYTILVTVGSFSRSHGHRICQLLAQRP